MIESLEKQSQIKILPAFAFNGRARLREADLKEVVKAVEEVLPRYVNGDMEITITLLEKNLKIMADMALMRETLAHLIENAMDAMPGYGKFSLAVNKVNFEIASLLNRDDPIVGACAFVSLAEGGTYAGVDGRIGKKMLEPFFTTKTDGKGPGLAIAYRIITQHHGGVKSESRTGQGTEVNIYLPLTRLEIVSMMSIPLDVSPGGVH